jgi:tartrate dehydratase alpha subunit/fumarate hydratase class I-like protein
MKNKTTVFVACCALLLGIGIGGLIFKNNTDKPK